MTPFRAGIEPEIELAAADQVPVGHPARLMRDDAIAHAELIDRRAEMPRRHLHQRLARRRRGEREIRVVEVLRMRLRAGRDALVGRRAGLALNQLHPRHRHAELLGDELRLCGVEALPDFAFAGKSRDGAVRRDRKPAVEVLGRITDQCRERLAQHVTGREREGHNQRARPLQHVATGDVGHARLPSA